MGNNLNKRGPRGWDRAAPLPFLIWFMPQTMNLSYFKHINLISLRPFNMSIQLSVFMHRVSKNALKNVFHIKQLPMFEEIRRQPPGQTMVAYVFFANVHQKTLSF